MHQRMFLWEIIEDLKRAGRPPDRFKRLADTSSGYWSINSDERFQYTETDGAGETTTIECAFEVDDVIKDDWVFIDQS